MENEQSGMALKKDQQSTKVLKKRRKKKDKPHRLCYTSAIKCLAFHKGVSIYIKFLLYAIKVGISGKNTKPVDKGEQTITVVIGTL